MHYIVLTLWGIGIFLALVGLKTVIEVAWACYKLKRPGAGMVRFQDVLLLTKEEARARGLKVVHFPDSDL
jgi:hypothetical protein